MSRLRSPHALGIMILVGALSACGGDGNDNDNNPAAEEPGNPNPPEVTIEDLGKRLFFDTNLSTPPGQACASCHEPDAGFADPDQELPVSKGVHADRFGSRNSPTAAYAAFSPEFHFDDEEGLFIGGQFLDGRAATLEEQAKGPFVNPVEMANPDEFSVVEKVRQSDYADLFEAVFGEGSLDDTAQAYENIAAAIAAFERTPLFSPFSSKYDRFLAGETELTEQELRGLEAFEAEDKGNCAACHPSRPDEQGNPPLFTDFSYDNLGVPANPDSPFLTQDPEFNPEGEGFVDLGLGVTVSDPTRNGKFKVPTLRNIDITGPYMHNGVFADLHTIVDFYNTRDVRGDWPPAEVEENVNDDELGNLGLSDQEVEDIVAFIKTLTDGFEPAP